MRGSVRKKLCKKAKLTFTRLRGMRRRVARRGDGDAREFAKRLSVRGGAEREGRGGILPH